MTKKITIWMRNIKTVAFNGEKDDWRMYWTRKQLVTLVSTTTLGRCTISFLIGLSEITTIDCPNVKIRHSAAFLGERIGLYGSKNGRPKTTETAWSIGNTMLRLVGSESQCAVPKLHIFKCFLNKNKNNKLSDWTTSVCILPTAYASVFNLKWVQKHAWNLPY